MKHDFHIDRQYDTVDRLVCRNCGHVFLVDRETGHVVPDAPSLRAFFDWGCDWPLFEEVMET